MKRIATFCAAFFVVVTAHSQTAEPVNLTNEEAVASVKGKTLSTQNTAWGNVRLQFEGNGTVYASGNGFNNSGKWKMEGGGWETLLGWSAF